MMQPRSPATSSEAPEGQGGVAAWDGKLHVGRPNIGDRQAFLERVNGILDRRWFTNNGPLVQEFEGRICSLLGVRHAVATCNATAALDIAIAALGLKGEVILPSFTFIATAHAFHWRGIRPVFADIDPHTHNIDPARIEELIGPRTSAIVGVHLWGRACDTAAIEEIAQRRGLVAMYDASHAFGCSSGGRMLGGFGACEVFSFHATKFINCFEGGVVATNDAALADRLRLMRNFGFRDYDDVAVAGVNAKMNEVCAAMGLTCLDSMDAIASINIRNFEAYRRHLRDIPGVSLLGYDGEEQNNHQYVVVEVDEASCPATRDGIVEFLHGKNVIARKYFWPGCHGMEPYRSLDPEAAARLPQTERVAGRVIVLPTGQATDGMAIEWIANLIRQYVLDCER